MALLHSACQYVILSETKDLLEADKRQPSSQQRSKCIIA